MQLLKILRRDGQCSLQMLAAKTGLSRSAIQRDHELYLMRKNLLVIDGKRNITNEGVHLVEAHCKKNAVGKSWASAILNSIMTQFWLIENLIKEYVRRYREDKMPLDDFMAEYREILRQELDISSVDERMKEYDEYDNWNDDASA